MNESEARLILNLSPQADDEDIEDSYEEAVFEQASFFMRRTFLPKLAQARIRKLEKIREAAVILGVHTNGKGVFPSLPELHRARTIQELIQAYNTGENAIKLVLANCFEANQAIEAFEKWMMHFETYAKRFIEVANVEEKRDVKVSQSPIFTEFSAATTEEREELIIAEYNRLKRIYS